MQIKQSVRALSNEQCTKMTTEASATGDDTYLLLLEERKCVFFLRNKTLDFTNESAVARQICGANLHRGRRAES
jgi:hypothetical protein